MLDMKAFNAIFKAPAGDRVNEQGKPRHVSIKNESAVFLAIDSMGIALVLEIIKHTGLKKDTVSRALYWLEVAKKINGNSAGLTDSRIKQYSLRVSV